MGLSQKLYMRSTQNFRSNFRPSNALRGWSNITVYTRLRDVAMASSSTAIRNGGPKPTRQPSNRPSWIAIVVVGLSCNRGSSKTLSLMMITENLKTIFFNFFSDDNRIVDLPVNCLVLYIVPEKYCSTTKVAYKVRRSHN